MLTIQINNPEIEKEIFDYLKNKSKKLEEITVEAFQEFLKKDKLTYKKLDPLKHMKKIEYDYDEDLCDEVALTHIKDSAEYIHNLRRKRNL